MSNVFIPYEVLRPTPEQVPESFEDVLRRHTQVAEEEARRASTKPSKEKQQ